MGQIIKKRERIHVCKYEVFFDVVDEKTGEATENCGYAFEADKNYTIYTPEYEIGRENLAKCLSGEYNVVRREGTVEWDYVDAAVLKCNCGKLVYLYGFTNTCDNCDADYNMSGDRLAPRSQWEPEDLYDCFGPTNYDPEEIPYY